MKDFILVWWPFVPHSHGLGDHLLKTGGTVVTKKLAMSPWRTATLLKAKGENRTTLAKASVKTSLTCICLYFLYWTSTITFLATCHYVINRSQNFLSSFMLYTLVTLKVTLTLSHSSRHYETIAPPRVQSNLRRNAYVSSRESNVLKISSQLFIRPFRISRYNKQVLRQSGIDLFKLTYTPPRTSENEWDRNVVP